MAEFPVHVTLNAKTMDSSLLLKKTEKNVVLVLLIVKYVKMKPNVINVIQNFSGLKMNMIMKQYVILNVVIV